MIISVWQEILAGNRYMFLIQDALHVCDLALATLRGPPKEKRTTDEDDAASPATLYTRDLPAAIVPPLQRPVNTMKC